MSRYDELRRLAAEATPGPWRYEGDDFDGDIYGPGTGPYEATYVAVDREGLGGCVRSGADGRYIAAASPDTITALLEERDRLIAALTEYAIDYHAANVEQPHGHTDPFERCPHKVCTDARNLLHHPYQEEE